MAYAFPRSPPRGLRAGGGGLMQWRPAGGLAGAEGGAVAAALCRSARSARRR